MWLFAFRTDVPDFTALLKRDPQYLGAHAWPLMVAVVAYIVVRIASCCTNPGVSYRSCRRDSELSLSSILTSSQFLWSELFRER